MSALQINVQYFGLHDTLSFEPLFEFLFNDTNKNLVTFELREEVK